MTRWQKVLLGCVATLLAVVLGMFLLIGTEPGSRWLLAKAPGLEVSAFKGKLGGSWQAERVLWLDGAGSEVELTNVRLDWSPVCLLRRTLCVKAFFAAQIRVDLVPSPDTDADDPPLNLADFQLPLQLDLGHIEVGSLSIASQTLADIDVQLQGRGDELHIQRFNLVYQDYRLQARGSLRTSGDWLLELQAGLDMPPMGEQPWHIELAANGGLTQRLQLQARSSGYLDAQLSGYLAPLLKDLPASLRLTSERFLAAPDLPPTLSLTQLELTAEGNLADGYRLVGNSQLPGQGGAVRLALDGLVTAQGAHLAALELLADGNRSLRLTGEANWQQGLAAKAELNWQDFPWQRLYPMAQEPPVALRKLLATLDYQHGSYNGNFQSSLDGPAGAFELGSSVRGDLQQVELPEVLLVAGSGRVSGPLQIGFADGVSWNTALQVQALNPAYWVAELPGALAGPIRSTGVQRNGQLSWTANVDLQGSLRQQPTLLQLDALAEGERLTVPSLDLRVGANRVHGQVSAQPALHGQLDVALNMLAQLWPGLAGQLNGNLKLAGSLAKPQVNLNLEGRDLALDDQRIATLELRANLDARQTGMLSATLGNIRLGDTRLGQLDLQASGDRQRQAAELRLDGPQLQAQLAADGALAKGNWQGRLSRARLQSGAQDWQLQQPASVRRTANGQLDLGAHCWLGAIVDGKQPSLCAPAQRLLPQPNLNYRLENFALQSLQPWLPDDFRWDGVLAGELKVQLPAAGPIGHLRLDAGPGVLGVRDPQQWQEFAYQRLQLTARMDAHRVESLLQFQSQALGSLELAVGLDPRKASKPLAGRFRIQAVDIGVARPFVAMLDELSGRLDGEGSISGELQAPRIDGQLRLRDGRLAGAQLPTDVEQLQADIHIAGQSLRLDGGWRGGQHGRAQLEGRLDWSQALELDLRLTGERLPVRIEPYAQLEAEPDLTLRLANEQLAVRGRLGISRGAIRVLELPPSTVKLSPDAQIVGVEREQSAVMGVAMDIQVLVGEDRLTFDGFGLTAELAGQLHIGDNLDTRGELNLNKGRYRAYGQRLAIRRARLFFAGPVDQPYLDVEAVRRVDEVVAGLRLTGSAAQPVTQIFSEPAMSQEQALSYLVLGRPMGGTGEDSNLVAQAALALGLAGSASITGGIARTLGIRDFELDTQGSGVSTSVVASGKLSERLSLRYGVGVFEPANTFALRYELTRRLYLEAASGLASSLDLFYRRDF